MVIKKTNKQIAFVRACIMSCLLLLIGAGLIVVSTSAYAARTESIAAIVNEGAITTSDVQERMKLIMTSAGIPNQQEILQRLKSQVMSSLIEEELKLQEADRLELKVTDPEINQGFVAIAKQNGFTLEKFAEILQKEGISVATLRDQIRAQISWRKVVQKELQPRVTISDSEVMDIINRLSDNKGKSEYRVSEIFLPVSSSKEQGDIEQLAQKLVKQIVEGGAPFQRLATQFSQSPGATKGGDMGWVQEGQLADELDNMLAKMKPSELSKPVRTLSGYHILYLHKIRTITDETIPTQEAVRNTLFLERLDRLQRRYLQDLQTAAFIDRRV